MHRFLHPVGRALLPALTSLLLIPALATAATEPAGFRPFAPDSIWNLPLRSDAPLQPSSGSYVSWLNQEIAKNGTWINTTSCGMPIYFADQTTQPVKVTLASSSYQDQALIRAWSAVPMPAGAKPANCSDKNLAIVQPQPDGTVREWEFWHAAQATNGSWSARWGGAVQNLGGDRGVASSLEWQDPSTTSLAGRQSNYNWNVTASSMSMIAGVITRADAQSGHIDHAVAFAIPDTAKGKRVWPAQRTDGASTDAYALPEGARLRLDPKLDLSKLTMTPLVRMIAEAAQKYGMVIRDRTYSTNVFVTEEPHAGETNPFKPLLDGQSPSDALKAFPWTHLQMLQAPACPASGACDTTQRATINLSGSPKVGTPLTLDTSNSVLNQPRDQVLWDLDGDGRYETDANAAVKETFVPRAAGSRAVSVKITTRAGSVVTGWRTITVAP